MERVTFVVEVTGDRISALLNPESLETRRLSGLRRRRGAGGVVMGQARTDDPLIATGGGLTEYDLYLLFDTEVAREGRGVPAPLSGPANAFAVDGGAPASTLPSPGDVRELTRPLWSLSENAVGDDGASAPPTVRFIWGKAWNVPGVVVAVAERLEQFDADGAPQRSWLSLRLRRVEQPAPTPPPPAPISPQFEPPYAPAAGNAGEQDYDAIPVQVDDTGAPLERLDQIAADHYGDPALARALASFNGLDDLLRLTEGASLVLPPLAVLAGYA